MKLNKHKLESVLAVYKAIEKKYGLDLEYSHLLRNNDIMKSQLLPKSVENKVLKAVRIATDQVIEMRLREGKSIEKEFMGYISTAKKDLSRIESIYLKSVNKKVNSKTTSESKVEELEKMDVTEEIDRTKSHFDQIILSVKSARNPFITDITIIKIATPSIIPRKENRDIIFKKPCFLLGLKFLIAISFSV